MILNPKSLFQVLLKDKQIDNFIKLIKQRYMKNIIFLTILFVAGVSCWWDGGHMLTAEVAKQEILARNATLFA